MVDKVESGDVKENQGNIAVGSGVTQTYNDHRTYHNGAAFSHEQEKLCRAAYLGYVLGANGYIRPAGVVQTYREVKLAMDEVYFHLSAAPVSSGSEADLRAERELRYLDQRTDLGESEREWLRRGLVPRTSPASTAPVKLDVAAKDSKRLAVLGEPGAGKTTLMRYLAYAHASAMKKGRKNLKEIGAAKLPIYIRIGEYATAREKNSTLSLRDYLVMYYQSHNCKAERLDELFALELARGNAILLLDGLDEITVPAERGRIVQRIEEFVSQNSGDVGGNRFVVTSRVAGYDAARLGADWTHYTIKPMERDDVAEFLKAWCPAVERQQMGKGKEALAQAEAEQQIKGIMQAVDNSEGVKRLATNPLLLTIITLIYKTGARLPDRRIELYDLAAETLARTWQEAKEGFDRAALIKEDELADVLGPLAYCMHANRASGLVTEGEARQFIRRGLAKKRDLDESDPADQNELEAAVDDFIARVQDFTGLFGERGANEQNERLYSFMHLTFEEYFAARYLAMKFVQPEELLRLLRRHLHDARWEEVILLTLGYIRFTLKFADSSADILERLCLDPNRLKPPYEDIFHRDLLFALRTCGDGIEPRRKVMKEMVDEVLGIYFDWNIDEASGKGRYNLLREQIATAMGDSSGSLRETVLNSALELAESKGYVARHILADILGVIGTNQILAINTLLGLVCDADSRVRRDAASALGNIGVDQAEVMDGLLKLMATMRATAKIEFIEAMTKTKAGQFLTLNTLLELMNSDIPYVRGKAIQLLADVGRDQPKAKEALLNLLQDPDVFVRWYSAEALVKIGINDHLVGETLLELFTKNDGTRISAAEALGRIAADQPTTMRSLLKLLNDDDAFVRSSAAYALGKSQSKDPSVISTLLELLEDKDWSVRSAAAYALGEMGLNQQEVAIRLVTLLTDEDNEVRSRAAYALGNMMVTQPSIVDAITEMLTDKDSDIRSSAAYVLGSSGLSNDTIVDGLIELLNDEYKEVRSNASYALSRMRNLTYRKHDVLDGLYQLVFTSNRNGHPPPYDAAYTALYTIVSAECSRGDEEICKGLRVREEEGS